MGALHYQASAATVPRYGGGPGLRAAGEGLTALGFAGGLRAGIGT
jgi:hypothetical protein